MSVTKYLYGAAVQGIQGFIFQTNKLKEIAGASEMVEQICTNEFAKILGRKNWQEIVQDDHLMLAAAGNIKYIFENKEDCKKVVGKFPMQITQFAPGITISQAVVEFSGDLNQRHIDELERKLKTQRNKAINPFTTGLMAFDRCRRTGLPATSYSKYSDNEPVDQGTAGKEMLARAERVSECFFGSGIQPDKIPLEFEEITKTRSKNYSWLAVVHADGNNMGLKIQEMSREFADSKGIDYAKRFNAFSKGLDKATRNAAAKAYKLLKIPGDAIQPCRPVIVGGDDLTIILRADLALNFTKNYLKLFEEETKEKFSKTGIETLKNGLTACAGISFIKESYPFHYGYQLAEELCGYAKKIAKTVDPASDLTPSCLMFHKIRDSFVESYDDIVRRELTFGKAGYRFCYGPYFLEKKSGFSTVKELEGIVNILSDREGNAIKSHLRQWLTDLSNNSELAKQKIDRLLSVGNQDKVKKLGYAVSNKSFFEREESVTVNGNKVNYKISPVQDWLTILSINEGRK